MADASAKHTPDVHSSPPPSQVPANHSSRSKTPCEKRESNDGKPIFTNRIAPGSPLRNVDTNRSPPVRRRPHPSTTASIASRASSLPTTPLDDIPEQLWPRVFPMATTPEMSNPELSIDEITSTRLSHDDQVILSNLPREADQREAQNRRILMRTTFGSMWGENNGRLKKMTKKLRKIPSGLFSRKGRRAEETLTSTTTQTTSTAASLPQLEITTELYVPATRTSSNSARSITDNPPTELTDDDCKPTETELREQEMAKISQIIRKDVHEARNRDRILPPSRSGITDPVPHHFLRAPTYKKAVAASAMDLTHTAIDQLLHGPRSRKTASTSYGDEVRAPSIGSVEELRTHAFGNRRASRPSLSGRSSMQNSAPSINRTSYSASRPATHSGSISSISGTLVRTPQLFMDAPNASFDSLWRVPTPQKRPLTLSAERPMSKGSTLRNGRAGSFLRPSTASRPVAQIGVGFGDLPEYNKLPLCVPRRVELTKALREPEKKGRDDAEDDDGPSELHDTTLSTPPLSDKSFGSLSVRGQTSVRSDLERHAMLQEQVEESNPAAYYWES